MRNKNSLIVLAGMLIIVSAVFYFYNYVYLRNDVPEISASPANTAVKKDALHLDLSFFESQKVTELKENKAVPHDLSEVKKGKPDLFGK